MRYLKPFNESSTTTDVDYYKSAIHYFNNNLNNDRALEYINKAIELSDRKSNPYYFALKQMIEEKGPEPKFESNEQQIEALKDLCRFCKRDDPDKMAARVELGKWNIL